MDENLKNEQMPTEEATSGAEEPVSDAAPAVEAQPVQQPQQAEPEQRPKQAQPVQQPQQAQQPRAERVDAVFLPNKTTETIANMVTISAIIWILVSVYQIVIGLVLLIFGVGIASIACGGWNIYACIRNFKHASYVRNISTPMQGQGIVAAYENSLAGTIIVGVVNLFLGGGIGVIGCVFDLILRGYVLKHRSELGA